MTAFIMKMNDGLYNLVSINMPSWLQFNVIANLSKEDYAFMIDALERMESSFDVPFYYYFPRYKTYPELQVVIVKLNSYHYQLSLNLGAIVLSEMTANEFKQLLYELKDLVSQFTNSKVYFPSLRKKKNDN